MKILIPNQLYVGAAPKHTIVSMTAWGTDSVSKKRMTSVATSAGGEQHCVTIDNTPQVGFQLIKSGWKDTWHIRDPRGFQFVIANNLLDTLIPTCVISQGMILNPCVYGSFKNTPMLLNTQSELYDQAALSTQVSQSKESWKKVKPGYDIVLRTGVKGKFMGKYHVISHMNHNTQDRDHKQLLTQNKIQITPKPLHVIFTPGTHTKPQLLTLSNPALAQIALSQEISAAQAEADVNEYLITRAPHHMQNWWQTGLCVVTECVSRASLKFTQTPITQSAQEVSQWFTQHASSHMTPRTHARLHTGELVKLTSYRNNQWQAWVIHEPSLTQGELRYLMKTAQRGGYAVEDIRQLTVSQVSQIVDLHLTYVTQLGNQVHVTL